MEIYTTGDVARICCVAPRTVVKWLEAGHLKGYILPDSRHRRITKDSLVTFMEKHGIPMDELGEESCEHST